MKAPFHRTLALAVLILLSAWRMASPGPEPSGRLLATDPETDRTLFSFPVADGQPFSMRYIHSVDRSPVWEYFTASAADGIVLEKTCFYMFGAGMGHWEGHGRITGDTGGSDGPDEDRPDGRIDNRDNDRNDHRNDGPDEDRRHGERVCIVDIHRPIGRFLLRVGLAGVDHTLTAGGRTIHLSDKAPGQRVEVFVSFP